MEYVAADTGGEGPSSQGMGDNSGHTPEFRACGEMHEMSCQGAAAVKVGAQVGNNEAAKASALGSRTICAGQAALQAR